MKTKNIFKALAMAMLMPATMLTTACSSDDSIINDENTATKGFELPVTVNVTREGDKATTRATYTDNGNGTGTLGFSTGDKLLVKGMDNGLKQFAGILTWQSGGTFSGTITTENTSYTGTADDLFKNAMFISAYLLPAGYDSKGFIKVSGSGYQMGTTYDYTKAFALTKAEAVEQLSKENADSYSSGTGFALAPLGFILNFTITGLTPSTEVAVAFTKGTTTTSGNVTTDGSGNATFAISTNSANIGTCTLTVGGNNIALPSTSLKAGKVYNIARSAAPGSNTIDLSTVTVATTAQNGDVLTGTLGTNVQISIADGATVILNNVNINGSGTWKSSDYAGLTCLGDATIILSGTNTVRGFSGYYPGLQAGPAGKTLTIKGTGSLTALYANVNYPGGSGIGAARLVACGNIVIEGGNITATGGYAGIGGAYGYSGEEGTCGDITILGGTVTATALSYGAGIGAGRGEYGSCGNITISGGTVTAIATAKNSLAAAIGAGSLSSTCTSVTIGTGITSLTMTNGHKSATGIVSNFINATAVNANTTPITTMLSTSVTDPTITMGMGMAGFATLYDEGTKTWTVTKK